MCCSGEEHPAWRCRARWPSANMSGWTSLAEPPRRAPGAIKEQETEEERSKSEITFFFTTITSLASLGGWHIKSRSGSFIPVQSPRSGNNRRTFKRVCFLEITTFFKETRSNPVCYSLKTVGEGSQIGSQSACPVCWH